MKTSHDRPEPGHWLRRKLNTLISPEGSLSLILPPGLDQPGTAAEDLLEAWRKDRARPRS